MTNTRRRKLSEEEFVEVENEDDMGSFSGSKTMQTVPLSAVRHQICRVLEIFIIVQFTVGAFIFFTGIFLLSWAVTPGTAFKAASYMLLAGIIIGRSLLGLVGVHPGRSGPLFAYGSILLFTCILRTIMILVCMKILMGAENFTVPPLLTAAPGALSPSIELICAIIEASQALCAFYVSWIIDKQDDAEKDYNDQQLEAVLINLRALQRRRHLSGLSKKSQNSSQKNSPFANKHELSVNSAQQQQTQQPTQAEIDYFAVYKRYPRNTPTPTIPKTVPKSIEPEPEVENLIEEIDQELEENKVEVEESAEVQTNKRQLPKRPYTLDYAPPGCHKPIEQANHVLPIQKQLPAQHYYPQYREAYSYYDAVAKTPPEQEMEPQFEPYSQANSPLLFDRRHFYGATSSRAANEFEYRAFNSHYP